ncbi:MarR family winged helix-turn-helix transcriptional regulator [Paraoerskovia marina]|uniref:MarR family winged helix-turn-helix transcriptional regulator n=1 Tax=Paraoerskovia marina TaxID=545619 RepID=UPI00049227E5|nr:MarR family transcriptional regulator [Paraoerskovia marina]
MTTHASTDLPDLAAELRVGVGRLHRRLRHQRGTVDLPDHLVAVLGLLNRAGALTPGALAEHECVRPPQMTRSVNALVESGYVAKMPHPSDGRQVVVEITDAGRDELVELRRRRDEWLAAQLETLDDADRQVLEQAAHVMQRMAGGR